MDGGTAAGAGGAGPEGGGLAVRGMVAGWEFVMTALIGGGALAVRCVEEDFLEAKGRFQGLHGTGRGIPQLDGLRDLGTHVATVCEI